MKLRVIYSTLTFFACLILASCHNGKKKEATFFKGDLYDDTYLHEIRMQFTQIDFWDTLVWNKKLRDSLERNEYLKSTVTIDGTELKDVGVRLKGESSYDFTKGKKKSFKLDLNYFVRKQKYKDQSRINLNNNYKDPSLMREKLALDMLQRAELPSPRSAYAKVYLNDEYWGVYLMVEAINKQFLRRNFKNKEGNLYIGEPNGRLEKLNNQNEYFHAYRKKSNKKQNNWSDLIRFVETINSVETEKNEAQLDSIFSTENCLKTWAVNNLLVNVDCYNMMYPHNYYLYYDSTNKKLNWINYDYNYSFAAWNPKFKLDEVHRLSIYYCDAKLPLANLILNQNSELKKRYAAQLKNLLEKEFDEAIISEQIEKYDHLLKDAIYEDTMKEFSNEEYEKNKTTTLGDKNDPGAFIPGLLEFVRMRKAAVLKQLKEEKLIN